MSQHHHDNAGHAHGHAVDSYQMEDSRWSRGNNALMFTALVGIVACVAGYFMDPGRFFHSYLVAFCFTTFIGIGALFFVMVQYLTGSAWSVTLRRIMENIMVTLPVGLVLFIPVLIGMWTDQIYPWTDPQVVAASAALRAKSAFLQKDFFAIRGIIYFVLWSIWSLSIYRQSVKQDRERSIQQMHAASAWSAPGLFLGVVVGSIAAFDWLMSLEPAWYSTIFGLVTLTGGALAFFSVVVMCSCPTTSSKPSGRYFLAETTKFSMGAR